MNALETFGSDLQQLVANAWWPAVAVGLLLLVAGRTMVWLAIGSLGAVAGWSLATALGPSDGQAQLIVAIVAALLGAVLAFLVQKIAVTIGGAILGGLIAAAFLGQAETHIVLIAVLAAAVVGGLLAGFAFAVAVSLVTAAAGAMLVAGQLPLAPPWQLLVGLVLAVIGASLQLRRGGSTPKDPKPKKAPSE